MNGQSAQPATNLEQLRADRAGLGIGADGRQFPPIERALDRQRLAPVLRIVAMFGALADRLSPVR